MEMLKLKYYKYNNSMIFQFIGTYLVLLALFYSRKFFNTSWFIIAVIIISIAVYIDLHVNPAYTILDIFSGTGDIEHIFTRILPTLVAVIFAAITITLLR